MDEELRVLHQLHPGTVTPSILLKGQDRRIGLRKARTQEASFLGLLPKSWWLLYLSMRSLL